MLRRARQRVPVLPSSLFGWIPAILFADAAQIVAKNGLDAYCFVRFLYLMLEIFLPVTACVASSVRRY